MKTNVLILPEQFLKYLFLSNRRRKEKFGISKRSIRYEGSIYIKAPASPHGRKRKVCESDVILTQ